MLPDPWCRGRNRAVPQRFSRRIAGNRAGESWMRVVVDLNRCQAYAQCCYAAPGRFVLQGDEILVYDPRPPASERAAIDRAVQACPVRAIRVEHDRAPAERAA